MPKSKIRKPGANLPYYPGDPRIAAMDMSQFSRDVCGMTVSVADVLEGRAESATELTPQQLNVAELLEKHRRVSLVAANSMGKTILISTIIVRHLGRCRNNMVLVTSCKLDQLRRSVFPAITETWKSAFGESGQVDKLQLFPDPKGAPKWVCFGIAGVREEAFASYHPSPPGSILIVVDEASAMGKPLSDAIDGLMSNETARLLLCGNARNDSPDDIFRDSFSNPAYKGVLWKTKEHPNIQHGRSVYANAISPTWIEEMAKEHGRGSDEYMSRVEAIFPPIQFNADGERMLIDPKGVVIATKGMESLEDLYKTLKREEQPEPTKKEKYVNQPFDNFVVSSEGMGPDGQPERKVLGTAINDDLAPVAYGSSTQGE